jgi:hypothetical protein
MRYRIAPVVIASMFLGSAALAGARATKTSVTLPHATAVAGTVLPAGTYRLELDTANPGTVRFVQGKRTVAEAPVKVGLDRSLYAGNSVHSRTVDGQERLVKIVLGGSGLAIDFSGEAAGSSDPSIATTADRP